MNNEVYIKIKNKETEDISNTISLMDVIYSQNEIEFEFNTEDGLETLPYNDFLFFRDNYEVLVELSIDFD